MQVQAVAQKPLLGSQFPQMPMVGGPWGHWTDIVLTVNASLAHWAHTGPKAAGTLEGQGVHWLLFTATWPMANLGLPQALLSGSPVPHQKLLPAWRSHVPYRSLHPALLYS